MDYKLLHRKLQKKCIGLDVFIKTHKQVWIYGGGSVAYEFWKYLCIFNYEIEGFIVSDDYPDDISWIRVTSKPVKRVRDIAQYGNHENGIIIAVRKDSIEAIYANCVIGGIEASDIFIQHVIEPGFWAFNSKVCCISMKEEERKGFFKNKRILDDIGEKHGTDKSFKYNNYLNKYEFFLQQIRDKEFNMIELGVYKGASINMWEEYFPHAHIIGVDVDKSCLVYGDGRKEILIKDLSELDDLLSLVKFFPKLVVDDASHIWSHQIMAFAVLFPALKSGGVYIMEDTATSFTMFDEVGNYKDTIISPYEFMEGIIKVVNSDEPLSVDNRDVSVYKICDLFDEIEELALSIEMISVIKGSIIVIKK